MTSAPLDPLVGREAELARLSAHFDAGARIVTVVGPAGMGKTRLARAFLSTRGGERGFVSLDRARERDEVCARVAAGLGLRLSWLEPSDFVEELGYALEGRDDVWLVLDEAEGCVASVRALLERWLPMAARTRALVTSRERLGLAAERVLELGPLAIGDDPLRSDAGRLLITRAGLEGRLAGREDACAALIRALDGIPLAIELAAARLAVLGPAELLARLDAELDVLGGPARESAIQAWRGRTTLRDALEGSWRLLSPAEREALARCAAFRSSFRAGAAEAVIGAGALDALSALRDKSMVAREPDGDRLRLYAPVRAFALERAEALGVLEEARARHAGWFAAHAEEAEPEDLHELREALPWAASRAARAAIALGIAEILARRGPQAEAIAVLDQALVGEEGGAGDEAGSPRWASRCHLARGRALEVLGRLDEALESYAAACRDPRCEPGAQVGRASAELSRGQLEAARAASEAALASAGGGVRVDALRMRGVVAHAGGRLEDARLAYQAARALARELELGSRAARLVADLAAVRLAQRRLDEARELYVSALGELDPEAEPIAVGLAEGNLAILEQEQGNLVEAARWYAAGIARLRRTGHRLFAAHLTGYAGALAHERGDLDGAVARYGDALEVLERLGDARLAAVFAGLRGAAEAARDRIPAAEEAFEDARRALARVDDEGVAAAVELCRGHLDLARGRRDEDAAGARARAAARASGVDALTLERSDDARLAGRLLSVALGLGVLSVDAEAMALVLPSGERVELASRAVLWRLVCALLEARRARPGAPVESEALVRAGWPDERMAAVSAQNRLKVSLSTLRKIGLRDLLMRAGGGYLLDPGVPLA